MSTENPTNTGNHEQGMNIMTLLTRLNQIGPEEIDRLREIVKPYQLKNFDNMSEETREILALLNSCSNEELTSLLKKETTGKQTLGFHNIRGYLQKLSALTRDRRFTEVARQAENNQEEIG